MEEVSGQTPSAPWVWRCENLGFGSLDDNTLEVALTALDSLNASGKMIGIISHVEALKERIPTQIHVEKGGGVGHSRLSIRS